MYIFFWILLQVQDASEDIDDQDIATNDEDKNETIKESFFLILSTLFYMGSNWAFDAYFQNVSSEIMLFFPALMIVLGIFCVSIMKNNRKQENNVSFYAYIHELIYQFDKQVN